MIVKRAMVGKTVGTLHKSREWQQTALGVTVFSWVFSLENVLDEGIKMINLTNSQPLSMSMR